MVRFRALVLVSACVITMLVFGCGPTETAELVPAGEEAPQVDQRITRNVIYQPPAQPQDEGGSMLPDAVRGLWGKGKPKPGIDGEDTMKWANDTFEALKKKGLTTANNAGSWLTQDFKNMNAWEYKVVFIQGRQPITAEKKLNELGEQRWECFHVEPQPGSTVFYLKKPKQSYLRSLPTSDLMRLVPMMSGE